MALLPRSQKRMAAATRISSAYAHTSQWAAAAPSRLLLCSLLCSLVEGMPVSFMSGLHSRTRYMVTPTSVNTTSPTWESLDRPPTP